MSLSQTACTDSFRVYGWPFRLRTNVPDAERMVDGLYRNFHAPGLAPDPSGSVSEAIVERDGDSQFSWRLAGKAGTTSTLSGALWNLEAALCESIIRSQRRLIAIHAATIQFGNSWAMLAGCSQAGKTTLSLALARRGFLVGGDDVALVDPDSLTVLPIPRCFHLDDLGAGLLQDDGLGLPAAWPRHRFIVPHDFGSPAKPPDRAGWLIFMRGPRSGHPSIAAVSQAEMSALVLSETGQGPLTDSETIGVICGLTSGASCFTLTPGSLAGTADAVAALLTASMRSTG
jgi:hypothetical protein